MYVEQIGGIIDWTGDSSGQAPPPVLTSELVANSYVVSFTNPRINWVSRGSLEEVGDTTPPPGFVEPVRNWYTVNQTRQSIDWESWGTAGAGVVTPPVEPVLPAGGYKRPRGQSAVIHAPLFETMLIGYAPHIRAFDDTENQNALAILLMAT